MNELGDSPSADRDIDFCQKAIEAGYIVPAIVPTVLRKLNEKRLRGETTSIGQELILLSLMTQQQVKEILLTLENVELTCKSCGKKYIIRAYDPGRQYACKECGSLLEPADPNLVIEEKEDTNYPAKVANESTSTIGEPNPELVNLIPKNNEESTKDTQTEPGPAGISDPILEAAKNKLKNKGIASKNVFSIPDDMLEEAYNKTVKDNAVASEDNNVKSKAPTKKFEGEEFRKVNSSPEEPTELNPVAAQIQQAKSQPENDNIRKTTGAKKTNPNDNFVSKVPIPSVKTRKPIEKGSLTNLRNNSLKEIAVKKIQKNNDKSEQYPSAKDSVPTAALQAGDSKAPSVTKPVKFSKIEKVKATGGKTTTKIPALFIIIFIISLLGNAGVIFLFLDSRGKADEATSQLNILKTELSAKDNQIKLYKDKETKYLNEQIGKQYREETIVIMSDYYDNPSKKQALTAAKKIEEFISILPETVLTAAELYQNSGDFTKAVNLLESQLAQKNNVNDLKLKIALKLAEFYTFNLNSYDFSKAQLHLNTARQFAQGDEESTELIKIWENTVKNKKTVEHNFRIKHSYHEAIILLLNSFADVFPAFTSSNQEMTVTKSINENLKTAIKKYNKTYILSIFQMLMTLNSTKDENIITLNLEDFEYSYGPTVFTQKFLAKIYFAQQDYTKAESYLTWILNHKKDLSQYQKKEDKDFTQSIQLRASIKIILKKYKEAIIDLTAALKVSTANSTVLHAKRGETYLNLGNFEDALTDFNESLKRNPSYEVKKLQIRALIELSRFELAERRINEVKLELTTKDPELNLLMGMLLLKKDEKAEALEEFDEALNLNSKFYEAIYFKALILIEMSELFTAKEVTNNLLKLESTTWHVWFLQGLIALKEGRTSPAKTFFSKALKLSPPAYTDMIEKYMQ